MEATRVKSAVRRPDPTDPVDVVLVRWPEELTSVERLRAEGAARLLLIGAGTPPPESDDCREDWIRLPADEADLRARLSAVAARATRHALRPIARDDGRLAFRGQWVALSPIRHRLAAVLVEKFGDVVSPSRLSDAAWPSRPGSATALRVQVLHLRRQLAPLGLEIRTVPSRGYVLQSATTPAD
jgi:hypothetical protein